jgi:hypothetical protein
VLDALAPGFQLLRLQIQWLRLEMNFSQGGFTRAGEHCMSRVLAVGESVVSWLLCILGLFSHFGAHRRHMAFVTQQTMDLIRTEIESIYYLPQGETGKFGERNRPDSAAATTVWAVQQVVEGYQLISY